MTDDRHDEHAARPEQGLSRRRVLFLLGAGGAGYGLASLVPGWGRIGDAIARYGGSMAGTWQAWSLARWSDRATWGGPVPGPDTRVAISQPILLDTDAEVARLEIADGGSLVFDPAASRSLRVRGNVVVGGQLQMRPSSDTIVHRLVLTGADESRYQGGGEDVRESDTGVWVMHAGLLDLAGASKLAWTRAAESIPAGATRITLREPPTGWRAGDTVVLTPTVPPGSAHHDAYDEATIAGIAGSVVTLSRPTRFAHPTVEVAPGLRYGAEVLNLTRNVQIEGTPEGRVHVFLHAHHPQSIRWAAFRHVGPRNSQGGVLGRYGLHFHVAGTASGSIVEGVVVRDAGNHAFVPHATQNASFRDCITHHTLEEAYWWDPGVENRSHDTVFERCVASDVRADPDHRGYRLGGFYLGGGHRNYLRDCVAVGVGGARTAGGFVWPEQSQGLHDGTVDKETLRANRPPREKNEADRESGVWGFENCVAHNNAYNGIFVWQNSKGAHVVDGFVGYHNGQAGIEHGAYQNRFQYRNATLYANGEAAVILHAVADLPLPTQSFTGGRFDGAGLSDYLVTTERHPLPARTPTEFRNCSFRGARKAAFGLVNERVRHPDVLHVVDSAIEGNEFWFSNGTHPETIVRVKDARLGTLELRRADQPGTYESAWNARVTRVTELVSDVPPAEERSREADERSGAEDRSRSGRRREKTRQPQYRR